jgi:galactose-1-phosphate uridylyltransferase
MFAGCANTEPQISRPIFVSITSKSVKFADMGFLNEFDDKKTMEVYSLGVPVFRIDFDDYVCINSDCMKSETFIREYVSRELYGSLFSDILSRKPLKIDSKITETATGFIQEATERYYDITYKVDAKSASFIERNSGFKFSVRFLDGN